MIVPFFQSLHQPRRFPATLLLVAINVVLYAMVAASYAPNGSDFEEVLANDQFLDAAAKIFSQMILQKPDEFAGPLQVLAKNVEQGDIESSQVLGRLALRNTTFMNEASQFKFQGDQVLYRHWKSDFQRFAEMRLTHPNYAFGFDSLTPHQESFITYQFLHGGWAHLVVNMAALVLVGSAVEPVVGSAWFLILYLLCGMGAALGFDFLSGSTPVPLIGASGSIMGLFGVLLVLRRKESVRFVWFLPNSQYAGFVFLPVWMLVGYLLLSDVAGFIETASWTGAGIAHAAHLGGFLSGVTLAWGYRLWRGHHPIATSVPPRLKGWFASPHR